MIKKMALTMAALLLSVALSNSASAAAWINGTILQVGYYNDFPYLLVSSADTPAAFSGNVYFMLNQTAASPLLATALTATSLGKNIALYVDSTSQWALCTAVAINN